MAASLWRRRQGIPRSQGRWVSKSEQVWKYAEEAMALVNGRVDGRYAAVRLLAIALILSAIASFRVLKQFGDEDG